LDSAKNAPALILDVVHINQGRKILKLIYKARDITEAHIISGLLKSNGIDAHVGGHYLQGGVGELAAMDFATISVANEDAETAASVIAEYEKNTSSNTAKQKNENNFILPVLILVLSVIVMLLLAISFSDYR
jgi:hypothetical protein